VIRKLSTSLLEIVGFGLIVAAFATVSLFAGLVAGGVALLAIGYLAA